MNNVLSFTPLTADQFVELTAVSTILGFAVGYVADAVMRERGFGIFFNGVLAIIGSIVSLWAARTITMTIPGDPAMVGAGVSLTGAIAALVLFGMLKNRVTG